MCMEEIGSAGLIIFLTLDLTSGFFKCHLLPKAQGLTRYHIHKSRVRPIRMAG